MSAVEKIDGWSGSIADIEDAMALDSALEGLLPRCVAAPT
jgi:hypothetical protein